MSRLEAAFDIAEVDTDSLKIKRCHVLLGEDGAGILEGEENSTWQAAKQLVIQHLAPKNELLEAKTQLENIRCVDNNFEECKCKIRKITRRLYRGASTGLRVMAEVDAFVKAMPQPVRDFMTQFQYIDLDTACQAAITKHAADISSNYYV